MHRLLAVLVAIVGIVAFSGAGQAMCGGHLDVADTDSTTVATDSTTTPIVVPDQSGG